MPGFEMFDQKEIDAVVDVLQRKMVHRYSFNNVRNHIWKVEEFEKAVAEKMGVSYCLGVSSGSAALYVALRAMGIGPGDEVITSPFTFIASVEAILECGAVPVLADIDESLNLSPGKAENCITEATKAIMPVQMFGASADMEAFEELCENYGLYLFEDSCQAMGATYKGKPVGTFGKWGTYSLDPYKVITTGEGGLILTDDEELYKKMEYYHDHGHIHNKDIDRGAEGKACLGFNFRMSEIQGALGLAQLGKLDMAVEQLRRNRKAITEMVGSIEGLTMRPLADPEGDMASQLVYLFPTERSARIFQETLKESGVGCGVLADNTWHYARHWETLREGSYYSRIRYPWDCAYTEEMPLYRPVEWEATHDILSRAAVFGMTYAMSEEQLENMATAIKVGARSAL